jgi:Peptidase family M48
MKKVIFILVVGWLLTSPLAADTSYVAQLYCSLLGDQDVDVAYKNTVYKALHTFGVYDTEGIPVKRMNAVGPTIAKLPLFSFTAFGIWLNEDFLAPCSENEKIFFLYHEAAHYAYKHHQHVLAVEALYLSLVMGLVHVLLRNRNRILHHLALGYGTGIASVINYFFILPPFIKSQEKEADIQAVRALMKDYPYVVNHRIEELKHLVAAGEDVQDGRWWCSHQEQIEYLEDAQRRFA